MGARIAQSRDRLAGIALSLVLAACGFLEPPDAGVPLENVRTTGRMLPGQLADAPAGPHVELLTATVAGQDIEIVMQRDAEGACLAIRRPPGSSTACGAVAGGDGAFGSTFGVVLLDTPPSPDPSAPLAVSGLVTAEVDSVRLELEGGSTARAVMFPLAPAGVEGSGFVIYVPADARQQSLVAFDADGEELERLGFSVSR